GEANASSVQSTDKESSANNSQSAPLAPPTPAPPNIDFRSAGEINQRLDALTKSPNPVGIIISQTKDENGELSSTQGPITSTDSKIITNHATVLPDGLLARRIDETKTS
ncbi:unnamed protein product, partial [Sphagnum balticum]